MSRVQSSPALDVISEDECYELLTGVQVGRVIVSIDALPAAFPVNYWLGDKAIVFRTAPGTKLTAAVSHTVVGAVARCRAHHSRRHRCARQSYLPFR
jgi:hypothetical protein